MLQNGQKYLLVESEDKNQMKKSFRDRIEAIESQHTNRQVNEPIIFFDEKCGITMQIIGNGLVVPVPMGEKEWEAMVESAHGPLAESNH